MVKKTSDRKYPKCLNLRGEKIITGFNDKTARNRGAFNQNCGENDTGRRELSRLMAEMGQPRNRLGWTSKKSHKGSTKVELWPKSNCITKNANLFYFLDHPNSDSLPGGWWRDSRSNIDSEFSCGGDKMTNEQLKLFPPLEVKSTPKSKLTDWLSLALRVPLIPSKFQPRVSICPLHHIKYFSINQRNSTDIWSEI